MKPLSELHKDSEACRKIGEILKMTAVVIFREQEESCTTLHDARDYLFIYDDGDISWVVEGRAVSLPAGKIVAALRFLGYDVSGERKDAEGLKSKPE